MISLGQLIERITSPKRKSGVFGKVYEVKLLNKLKGNEKELFESGTIELRSEKNPCRPAGFDVCLHTLIKMN